MQSFIHHCKKGKEFRSAHEDAFREAQRKHKGKLDFGAYKQGHDPMYLGINGHIAYGKPWGQDSGAMQSLMNPQQYWRRLYYRDNEALGKLMDKSYAQTLFGDEFAKTKKEEDPNATRLKSSASAPTLPKIDSAKKEKSEFSDSDSGAKSGEEKSLRDQLDLGAGYRRIEKLMEEDVMLEGKPHFTKQRSNEPLTFFNTIASSKYNMKGTSDGGAYDWSKKTHRTRKHEIKFIASLNMRTDTNCITHGPWKKEKW